MPLKPQRDLTNEGCYNGAAQTKVTLPQFRELICNHCHNPECVHAKWGTTSFDVRVQTWRERLFGEGRQVSDLTLPRHLQIHQADFPDATAKALKLIISARNNNWDYIPDEDSNVIADPSTTSKVDEATRKLAEKRGQKAPEPPQPKPEAQTEPEKELAREAAEAAKRLKESPATLEEEEVVSPQPEFDTPPEEAEPEPADPPEGWTEEELERARRKDREAGVDRRPGNTPMPAAGIMVDGSPPKKTTHKTAPKDDPWAPKNEKKVEPGTKIVLGGKNEDNG
jgi:hypothetical protein